MILNTILTQVFKEIILKERLYDTGALYRSIQVYTDFSAPPRLAINIVAEDYVKYYITERGLSTQLLDHPLFETEVDRLIFKWMSAGITSGLLSAATTAPLPSVRCRITYNGV